MKIPSLASGFSRACLLHFGVFEVNRFAASYVAVGDPCLASGVVPHHKTGIPGCLEHGRANATIDFHVELPLKRSLKLRSRPPWRTVVHLVRSWRSCELPDAGSKFVAAFPLRLTIQEDAVFARPFVFVWSVAYLDCLPVAI